MTGAQIFDRWLIKLDELGSNYVDTTRGNSILADANINVVDKKIQEFQATNKITREMQPLINSTGTLTPSGAQIDISASSTTVPDYYQLITISITAPYRGSSLTNYAKERPYGQFQSAYTSGDARYPRYYLSNGLLTIEPSDATFCDITYFKKPIVIDVTDSSADIPYNDKLVEFLLDEAMIILGIAGRDQQIIQNSVMQEQKNP